MAVLPRLRYQPTAKRVRIELDGVSVADAVKAALVWEPMRIVPSYAVAEGDVTATLEPAPDGPAPEHRTVAFGPDSPPLLDPSVPFAVHTAPGVALTVVTSAGRREGAAFRLAGAELAGAELAGAELDGYVVFDFPAFSWWEEDEQIMGHPQDPFHRIDVRRSSRHIRIEHEGHVLAESSRPCLLFEGTFPMARYYLPREDVAVELTPGTLRTTCAYKGHATHYSAVVDGDELPNVAWSYEDPRHDAEQVAGLICFYQERLDLFVDGRAVDRVRTPWS